MGKRYYTFGDIVNEALNDVNYGLGYFSPLSLTTNHSFKGKFVDTDEFDIVPKKSFKEKQLKFKEERLRELKERRKNDNMLYDEQEKELQSDIDALKKSLSG